MWKTQAELVNFKLKFTRVTLPESARNAWSSPQLNLLAFGVHQPQNPTSWIPLILNVMPPQKSPKPTKRPQPNGNRYAEVLRLRLRLPICSNPTQSRKENTHWKGKFKWKLLNYNYEGSSSKVLIMIVVVVVVQEPWGKPYKSPAICMRCMW